jgi:GDP-L-fucose synthase
MEKSDPILVAGAGGMVGAAIVRNLEAAGFTNLLTPRRQQLDLRDTLAVREYLADLRPRGIYVAAATVGGIHANDAYAADFIYDNLMIEANLINGAHAIAVEKLLFLGSTCIYPKLCPQPIKEEYLLTGPLEPSNEWYAVAKIAGVKLCQAYRKQHGDHFICAMPTNLYGPNDDFDLENSHVLPALIRKFHEAKEAGAPSVTVWGSGAPFREFLHVDDCAAACTFLMQHYDEPGIVNIGVGHDISILDLANLIRGIVGFDGELLFDASKPDGTPRKLVDVTKITELGWRAEIELSDGIAATYAWYREALRNGTARQ